MRRISKNIVVISVYIVIEIFGKCFADFSQLHEMTKKLDSIMMGDADFISQPHQVEGRSWIWKEYQFGSGFGNREELLITDVKSRQSFEMEKDIRNWQFLEYNSATYIVGLNESTVIMYRFNKKTSEVSLYTSIHIPVSMTIKSFRAINSIDNIDTPFESNEIYLVLSMEDSNRLQILKWFYLHNQKFIQFWTWDLQKAVKNVVDFKFNEQHKLLLLYEDEVYFNDAFTLVEIYEVQLNKNASTFYLCNKLVVPVAFNVQVCPPQGEKTIITFLVKDHLIVYEYKDKGIQCTFEKVQIIPMNGLINTICFESGYVQYLASSGTSMALFKYHVNQFVNDKNMEKLFKEIGEVSFVQSLPVETYRDEEILFAQLKNSTMFAFTWQGLTFKPIFLSNHPFGYFNLSTALGIPNYGFFSGNTLLKFNTKLNKLPRPEETEMGKMLETKSFLEELLFKQELIINKTNLLIEQNYLYESVGEELLDIEEVEIDNLTVNNISDFFVEIGSKNFSFHELQMYYNNVTRSFNEIEAKLSEIENNAKNALLKNTTNNYLHQININGDFAIRGTLTVDDLTIDYLNAVPIDVLMKECSQKKNSKIRGTKSFPTIQFAKSNLKIRKINGIPLTDIEFDEVDRNYTGIDLSKVIKLDIYGNLNFSKISDMNWDYLMKNKVLKNEKKIIRDNITVIGQITASVIRLDYLNGLEYAYDYIMKTGIEDAYMTTAKTFKSLTVSNLQEVNTINGIDADEFIILYADQSLEHEITFENLVIEERLQIDGEITGLPKQDIDPDLTLLNSNMVQSNTRFTTLHVSGKIYVENLVNGTGWAEFDDLILDNEEDIIITGSKIFLDNVAVNGNIEIKTGIINGHSVNDFVTIDTRQILPNLSKISGNFTFSKVSYEELKSLEGKLKLNIDDVGLPICSKPYIFMEPPTVDEFSFLHINENLTGTDFFKALESALKQVHFENLKVDKLIVEDLIPTTVNGINVENFKTQKISRRNNQNISGNITFKYLEVDEFHTDYINNRKIIDLEVTVKELNVMFNDIFKGNQFIHSLDVTGAVVTSIVNDDDLNDVLDINYIEQFTFRSNESINNIIVEGMINDFNFTEKIFDTVQKTEGVTVIDGPKKIKNLKTRNLHVDYINGRSIDDIISRYKDQTLSGIVKIKGSVNIEKSIESRSQINNVAFKNLNGIIQKIENKVYKLSGDFFVHENALIKDLNIFGRVQSKDINEFMDNLVLLDEELIIINGTKIFKSLVTFSNNITVVENLNEMNVALFYENVILIDRPIYMKAKLIFDNDILLENDLVVTNNLKTSTIHGLNIEELMENAVYLNRPTSIAEAVSMLNIIFKSDIRVEVWNDVPMDTLFTLNKDEAIRDTLMCVDAFVDHLEIKGFVNGENLTEIYETTFMHSADQNITGKISFLNNIYINGDFDSQYINNVDVTNVVSLNDDDSLIGNFIFENYLAINDSITLIGKLNRINISEWQAMAITNTYKSKQIITDRWTVYGNVDFMGNINGSGSINRINLQKINNDIKTQENEIQLYVTSKMEYLKSYCKELQEIKHKVENMYYKFRAFDYLKVIEFDHKIVSIHHFGIKDIDYFMVNFDTCDLDVLAYANMEFISTANFSNFGYIKKYITLNYEDRLFFVTVGRPGCGKNIGNLWSFENSQLKHLLDLGDVLDVEKFASDAFLIIVNNTYQEWHIRKIVGGIFEPVTVIPINDKTVQFFFSESDILLASQDTIYGLPPNETEFEEFENPLNSNSIFTFHTGIYYKEYILLYDEKISRDYILIYNNNLSQLNILQTINVIKPSSFLILNFDKFEENLLIFSENKRIIRIYEHKGIEGFKYHSSIKMKHDKLFNFQLRIQPNFVKRHCLGVVENNKLSILEAKMYGERLDMNDNLVCSRV